MSTPSPRFAIGAHLHFRDTQLCGCVRSVLHFPRSITYVLLYCDDARIPEGWQPKFGFFRESELTLTPPEHPWTQSTLTEHERESADDDSDAQFALDSEESAVYDLSHD